MNKTYIGNIEIDGGSKWQIITQGECLTEIDTMVWRINGKNAEYEFEDFYTDDVKSEGFESILCLN